MSALAMLLAACASNPGERATGRDTSSASESRDERSERRWRVRGVSTTDATGKETHSTITYDLRGRRLRFETTTADDITELVVSYRYDVDGDTEERIDIEPGDLTRYHYRVRADGQVWHRLRDGDLDGRFGSHVYYVFDADGAAVRREYRKLDRGRERLDATAGTLRFVRTYRYRNGLPIAVEIDREADGEVDRIRTYRDREDGRLISVVLREGERVVSTDTYAYERGPCDTRNLLPEAKAFCVDD